MKKIGLSLALFVTLSASSLLAESVSVPVHLVSASGIGAKIGEIEFKDGESGLEIRARLKQIPPGPHAMHIHENPACDSGLKDGTPTAALAAGPHYDPMHTGKHLGPGGGGHAGDLPLIEADKSSEVNTTVIAPGLKVSQINRRSIIIHENGDNYSDSPKPLGGAGGRIACGIIP